MAHDVEADTVFLDIARQLEPGLNKLYDAGSEAARDVRVSLLAEQMVRGENVSDALSLREGRKVAAQFGIDLETVGQLVLNRAAERLKLLRSGRQ